MPIFGQVWLWSSLAFLLGALLCWVLVALPARRRVGELEDELTGRRHHRQPPEHTEARHVRDDYETYDERERAEREDRRPMLAGPQEDTPEPLTRAYALPSRDTTVRGSLGGGLVAPPETDPAGTELTAGPHAAATQYLNVSAGLSKLEAPPEVPAPPTGRGWFDDDAPGEGEPLEGVSSLNALDPGQLGVGRLVDDEGETKRESAAEGAGGTVFTQRTHPIPGELIRQIDEAGKAATPADEPADAFVDDLADDDPFGQPAGVEPAATPGGSKTENRQSAQATPQPRPEAEPTRAASADGAQGQTEVMPVTRTESPTDLVLPSGRWSGADRGQQATDEPKIMPGVSVRADTAINPLPKRVPGKPRGHTPFGVKTSPELEPVAAAESEPVRSLFEPVVPAEDEPVVPPPHRVRGDGSGRGPFGPGSAMPLPDGGSPSPEFTIKASVSALRYCTPESPQFGRTVAEVWFKTPADAERVGFRPVS